MRNREDGTVEVRAAASREVLERFVRSLAEGPPMARVEGMEVQEWAPPGGLDDFQIVSSSPEILARCAFFPLIDPAATTNQRSSELWNALTAP